MRGLPYEECKRRQHAAPRDRAPLYPAFALPPFDPRARRRRLTIVVAATLPA